MKKFFLIATMLLAFGSINAQIAEVKQDGNVAKIYNDQGKYTGKYISLSSSREIAGFNSKYIVVIDGNVAKIYNEQASYTGKYISLSSSRFIKNVSGGAILVKDGNVTKYYDFEGKYTGNYTSN